MTHLTSGGESGDTLTRCATCGGQSILADDDGPLCLQCSRPAPPAVAPVPAWAPWGNEAFIVAMKAQSRLVLDGAFMAQLTKRRRLRCTWAPDRSYGRYHAPPAGNEALEYHWSVYTPALAAKHRLLGFVRPEAQGWHDLSLGEDGEREALALLQGVELPDPLALGKEMARRFA